MMMMDLTNANLTGADLTNADTGNTLRENAILDCFNNRICSSE